MFWFSPWQPLAKPYACANNHVQGELRQGKSLHWIEGEWDRHSGFFLFAVLLCLFLGVQGEGFLESNIIIDATATISLASDSQTFSADKTHKIGPQ